MKITEGKVHSFAYNLYVTSTARQNQKETGMDFEEAKRLVKEALPLKDFECVGGSTQPLIKATG